MRLTAILTLVFSFSTMASVYSQSTKLSVSGENSTLVAIFDKLSEQSEFQFVYNDEEVAVVKNVTVDFKNATVEEILNKILSDYDLDYKVVNKVVVITPAPGKTKKAPGQVPQDTSVSIMGKVVDETNQPLPGANILLKGTNVGTSTDKDGNYNLRGSVKGELVLVFSFIGYEMQEIEVSGRPIINVTMKSNLQDVSEVVVNGVFTRKANTYTGAVTTVKREELLKMSSQDVLSGLANIDPSFVKVDNLEMGSNPNTMPSYQLRGTSAISQNLQSEYQYDPNQPLFILDGFETTLEKIIDLDMSLIESITLLKDATAKAIYGSKGANGVVVVETRLPKSGKMRITYRGGLSLEIPDLNSYDLVNAKDKLEIERLAGLYTSDNYLTQLNLNKTYSAKMQEVLRGVNTDWLAQPVRTGVGQKHSMYLDGGNDIILYGVDLSYNKILGAMKGSGRETFSGGMTLTYRKKNLLLRNKLSITSNTSNDSPYGNFSLYAQMNPYSRLYDNSGNIVKSYNYNGINEPNPIWNTTINTKYQSQYTDITNNFQGEWTIRPRLKAVGRFGISYKTLTADNFKPASHTDFLNESDAKLRGRYAQTNGKDFSSSGDLGLNYSFIIGKHLLFANGQVNFNSRTSDRVILNAVGFPNDMMDHVIFAIKYEEDSKPTGSESVSHSAGGLLSVNYSFDERYLLDANYRLSGSSEVGANHRWGVFWSLGGGWNIHKESFLKNNPNINLLKLRVSSGYTGSQGFSTYEAMSAVRYYSNNTYMDNLGSYLISMANPNLKWQTKYDNSIGLDFVLFQNMLSGKIDYYVANTESMLTDITLPESTGFTYYRANLGKTQNKGVEATLNLRAYQSKKSRDYINIYSSVAHNTNKLKEISNGLRAFNDLQDENKDQTDAEDSKTEITTPSVRYIEGESINTIWAVRSLGIDPQNGKEIFLKKDGTTTYEWNTNDQVAAGVNMPKVTGNIGIRSEFYNIGCNISFYYRLGGQVYNYTLVNKVENANVRYNVDQRVFSERWQNEGDIARFKAISDKTYTRPSTRFVEDNNTLTLSSVNVYYDFRDTKIIKDSFMKQMRLNVNMNDIFVISSVKTERGTNYPFARNLTFSVLATF